MVFILYLGFGQRGLVNGTPEHRLQAFIDTPPGDKLAKLTKDRRLIRGIHREIRMLPVPEYTQPTELIPLDSDILLGVLPAEFADRELVEVLLFLAQLLENLVLDRQPMTIPAGDKRDPVSGHRLGLDDDVL